MWGLAELMQYVRGANDDGAFATTSGVAGRLGVWLNAPGLRPCIGHFGGRVLGELALAASRCTSPAPHHAQQSRSQAPAPPPVLLRLLSQPNLHPPWPLGAEKELWGGTPWAHHVSLEPHHLEVRPAE